MDRKYLHLLKDTEFTPVFILGVARSGTTILLKLLAETQCFNYVQSYHIIKYNEILRNHLHDQEDLARESLDKQYQALGISNRGIDHVKVTSSMPSEYGIILENHNEKSLLNGKKLLQGALQKGPNPFFDKAKLTSENLPLFNELARKIQFTSTADKPLLLKNPWDFNNFLYLADTFPQAKFIFIHRYPMATLNSQLNGLRTTLTKKIPFFALQSKPLCRIFHTPWMLGLLRWAAVSPLTIGIRQGLIARDLFWRLKYFTANISTMANDRMIELKYEELCADPAAVMRRLCSFLAVKPTVMPDYAALVQPRSQSLLPELERRCASICKKFKDYVDYNGYDCTCHQYLLEHKPL